ncbi:DUF4163 domain-containing protein [uncultured Erythrobacter sp.]|uniref:DUF4163 domain-containing protein n=1 Tax=uncultured Erythrobacter sp. TaxID=263913 RepID=UPI0026121A64|nr:DUF4163 domain-containing protein [uncultured Erythrobacter sp.]
MLVRILAGLGLAAMAACSSASEIGNELGVDDSQIVVGEETAEEKLERRLAGGAKAREIAVENDLMKFSYSWPAEAVAIAPLDAAMEIRAKTEQEKFEAMTVEAKADAEQYDYPYRPYDFSKNWAVAADTPGFLSLAAANYTYTGGAHGNSVFDSMIWDRKTEAVMVQTDMFVSPQELGTAVREDYCTGLRAKQMERLGSSVANETGAFDNCPTLDELVVVVGSSNGEAFDQVDLLAAPYVAGSYVEGSYQVTVPVTQAVMQAVKPEYRAAFALGS